LQNPAGGVSVGLKIISYIKKIGIEAKLFNKWEEKLSIMI
jgi:hypothetical protein